MKRLFLGLIAALLVLSVMGQPAVASRRHQAPQRVHLRTVKHVKAHPKVAADMRSRRSSLDHSLQLANLNRELPRLKGTSAARARAILARPTDHHELFPGHRYQASAKKVCTAKVCVHYVTRTKDAATRTWARKTLKVMMGVWRKEIGGLGYSRPPKDGRRGGDRRFDVYLEQIGNNGYYGYCAPEGRPKKRMHSYCVLDNNFSRREFRTRPVNALRVTAAHEFFHAIQFGYNALSDRWMMESTAVWMEDKVADSVNDYLQYAPAGQLGNPTVPLDTGANGIYYGNFAFWTYLSERYGADIVRNVWNRAKTTYSIPAIAGALVGRGGFTTNFAAYSAANLLPAAFYSEGSKWTRAQPTKSGLLTNDRVGTFTFSGAPYHNDGSPNPTAGLDHLTSKSIAVVPGKDGTDTPATRPGTTLTIDVRGPVAASSPGASVVVYSTDGTKRVVNLAFTAAQTSHVVVPFGHDQVAAVTITVANASQSYVCNRRTVFACAGQSRFDTQAFIVSLKTSA